MQFVCLNFVSTEINLFDSHPIEPEQEIILNLVEKFGSDFYVGLKKKHWANSSGFA